MHSKQYVGILLKQHLIKYPYSKVRERKNCFVSFCNTFNKFDINQVTTSALKAWFDDLKAQYKYTYSTMIKVKAAINHFFVDLIDENIITTNPLTAIKFKGYHQRIRERTVLSPEEIEEMLARMKELSPKVLYPYIFTLVHTGARRNEIRKLKWRYVDFQLNHIHLPFTKNGTERRIKMDLKLRSLLLNLKEERGEQLEYVFLNQWGKLLSEGQILDTIIKLQKLYPQKRWRPHDLRHSFAYNYLKRKGNMDALQAILGHKSIRMTVDLYGQMKASDVDMVSPYD